MRLHHVASRIIVLGAICAVGVCITPCSSACDDPQEPAPNPAPAKDAPGGENPASKPAKEKAKEPPAPVPDTSGLPAPSIGLDVTDPNIIKAMQLVEARDFANAERVITEAMQAKPAPTEAKKDELRVGLIMVYARSGDITRVQSMNLVPRDDSSMADVVGFVKELAKRTPGAKDKKAAPLADPKAWEQAVLDTYHSRESVADKAHSAVMNDISRRAWTGGAMWKQRLSAVSAPFEQMLIVTVPEAMNARDRVRQDFVKILKEEVDAFNDVTGTMLARAKQLRHGTIKPLMDRKTHRQVGWQPKGAEAEFRELRNSLMNAVHAAEALREVTDHTKRSLDAKDLKAGGRGGLQVNLREHQIPDQLPAF